MRVEKSAPKSARSVKKSAPTARKSAPRGKVIRPAPAKKARTGKRAASSRKPTVVVVSLDPRVVVLERLAQQLRQDALAGKRPETTAVELKRGLRAVLALMDIYPDSPVAEP